MRLSTQTLPLDITFGYEETIKILKKIGFDCYDLSMFSLNRKDGYFSADDYKERALSLRRAADEVGIACNQSHAPFPVFIPDNAEWNERGFDLCVRALEITSLVGGAICVVHPCNDWSATENAEKLYKPLLPYCKKFGVKIALENIWNWRQGATHAEACACTLPESFLAHLSLLDPEWFVACLDIGHAEMFQGQTSARELILALGDRLQALHVHDNNLLHDYHTAPYVADIDWDTVCAALREIGYGGDFTLEAETFVRKFPPELRVRATELLRDTGRYLIEKIKNG